MRQTFLIAFLVGVLGTFPAAADILIYTLPHSELGIVLQGEVTFNPGGTVTYQHPRMGKVNFRIEEVRCHKLPAISSISKQQVRKAIKGEDVEECLKAAQWSLHHGVLADFYEAASAAWKLQPSHPTVKRLAALKRRMDTPLPSSKKEEEELRAYVPGSSRMKILESRHFLLLHDMDAAPPQKEKGEKGPKKSRAQERLDLLEAVYQSFLLKFCLAGVDLEVPQERLKVVLFAQKEDFLEMAVGKAGNAHIAGFYSLESNVSVFYDQGTNRLHRVLAELNTKLQEKKQQSIKHRTPGTADLVRVADTLRILTEVARENADIEVVSHEATHHMAAATGLMPNEAKAPLWAAEGLATYFESPAEAAWGGIGAVNEERLDWYRELADDKEHSNIDFITSDEIFTRADSENAVHHAYGQSWALTHFLMEQHPDKLAAYYRLVAQRRAEERPTPEENRQLFSQIFGEDHKGLTGEWRNYMRVLKTDVEAVLNLK